MYLTSLLHQFDRKHISLVHITINLTTDTVSLRARHANTLCTILRGVAYNDLEGFTHPIMLILQTEPRGTYQTGVVCRDRDLRLLAQIPNHTHAYSIPVSRF